MNAFGDEFNNHVTYEDESDPAAEFLAREQSTLAGLVDDPQVSSASTNQSSSIVTNGIDQTKDEKEMDSGFELVDHSNLDSTAAETTTVTCILNGHDSTIQNFTAGIRNTSPVPSSFSNVPREEPEKIRRWREEQKQRLEKKDAEEEKKKTDLREAAKKELEEWYASHEEQVAKNRIINRSAEKELVADTDPIEPGTEWERIAKLCDFNPKGSKHQKDISRMRSIILQVKQSPPPSLANCLRNKK